MALVKPAEGEALESLAPVMELLEAHMGFVPNSIKTMAHRPDIADAFAGLSFTILASPGKLPQETKLLVAFAASAAHGCRYCQAHTAHSARTAGVSEDKINALWDFETSPLFSHEERTAMHFAQCAAQTPCAVDEADEAALKACFDEAQIVELVAVIALYGFLNRWNDAMGTTLEEAPAQTAQSALAPGGWSPGKHA